ncbi:MAG: VOC family protein [Acidimicrobiales bacterium]|nr:VOC family protein [Acidimicrobiales bacterium]MBO0892936.1 VOC family protein [Acidimicrobiales bacterium]
MPPITPFLWFDTQAEEAARFYVSVFPNSEILDIARYSEAGPGPAGSVMTVRFRLDGTELVALNGGPEHYGFNLGISFMVDCASAGEVDHYWSALTNDGEEGQCGWLKDRFGLSWQIVPSRLPELLGDPDPERATRAMQAMLSMRKLDIGELERAAAGGGANG